MFPEILPLSHADRRQQWAKRDTCLWSMAVDRRSMNIANVDVGITFTKSIVIRLWKMSECEKGVNGRFQYLWAVWKLEVCGKI